MVRLYINKIAASIFLLSLLAGCGSQEIKNIDVNAVKALAKIKEVGPSYRIGPGDQLSIFVWNNPELSTNVAVRPDGYITAPLVKDVHASGSLATVLASEIETRLSKYIKAPHVTVSITSFVGRYEEQIRVVGQAAQPQALRYTENMTVLDVIIAVGGLTEFADGNEATIIREVKGEKVQFEVRLDDLIKGGDITANIDIKPGDILIIPESWF